MLPNLALWLNDTGIVLEPSSSTVATWDDKSGNGNEAVPYTNQEPDLAFTIDPGIVNGHDAIITSGMGTNFSIADAPSLQLGTSGFIIGVVLRTGNGNLSSNLVSGVSKDNGMGNGLLVAESAGNYELTLGTQSVETTPTDYTHFHFIIATGEALSITTDGVSTVTGSTSTRDVSNAGAGLIVFQDSNPYPQGDEEAEIVMAKGPVSCSDVANLAAYFTTKFAL
jgi:hypothetical protein